MIFINYMNFLLYLSIFYLQLNLFFSANLFSKNNLLKKEIIMKHVLFNNNEKINFCVNCKHFRPYYIFLIPHNDFATCSLYNTIKKNNKNFLVTGKIKKEIEYTYCSIVRNSEDMCGKEGKDFVSKF